MLSSALQTCRVLFVDHTAALGGGEIALLHLVTNLDRTRYTPIVLLSSPGDLHALLAEAGIETHRLDLNSEIVNTRKDSLRSRGALKFGAMLITVAYAVRLARFIRSHKIDIVHTNSLKSDIFGGIAGRLAGRPVIWHVRDRIAEDYLPEAVARTFRFMARYIPSYIIANSKATLQTLHLSTNKNAAVIYSAKARFRVVHDGIIGTKNGVLPTKPKVSSTESSCLSTLRVGLVGRISPWKGQHIFIEAAAHLCKRFPYVRFQIIGGSLFGEVAYEAELRRLVAIHTLQERVEFLGFRSDIAEVIASLDILVHASTVPEPFGQVVIEGMAAGKPVVATRGGGVTEIITDGISGLLVTMGSVEEMTDAIATLLLDPERADRIGRTGRDVVAKQFTIENTVSAVQVVYDTIRRQPRSNDVQSITVT